MGKNKQKLKLNIFWFSQLECKGLVQSFDALTAFELTTASRLEQQIALRNKRPTAQKACLDFPKENHAF